MIKKGQSCNFDDPNAITKERMDSGETIICRCEEVTVREIENAIAQGAETLNEVKRITRASMGICQGRTCGSLMRKIFAEKMGMDLGQVEPTTVRPPVRPIALDALGTGVGMEEFASSTEKGRPKGWRYASQYVKEGPSEGAAIVSSSEEIE